MQKFERQNMRPVGKLVNQMFTPCHRAILSSLTWGAFPIGDMITSAKMLGAGDWRGFLYTQFVRPLFTLAALEATSTSFQTHHEVVLEASQCPASVDLAIWRAFGDFLTEKRLWGNPNYFTKAMDPRVDLFVYQRVAAAHVAGYTQFPNIYLKGEWHDTDASTVALLFHEHVHGYQQFWYGKGVFGIDYVSAFTIKGSKWYENHPMESQAERFGNQFYTWWVPPLNNRVRYGK
jgi:hypothetical protein